MTERPILFSTSMVRQILADKKTQTRRVIKFPKHYEGLTSDDISPASFWVAHCLNCKECRIGKPCGRKYWQCGDDILAQQYHPGDSLWVRETWSIDPNDYGWDVVNRKNFVVYRSDQSQENKTHWGWKPSISMPRWASRITLEITNIRVERVKDISNVDAQAEGVGWWQPVGGEKDYRLEYSMMWDSINAGRGYSWESNPLVWVIEFKRVTP